MKSSQVDRYINSFPEATRRMLEQVRKLIETVAPAAEESFSYGMPAYKTHGKPLIYFAGYKNHIGLYATPGAHGKFQQQLAPYKQGKGSVQFPLHRALPLALIKSMIRFNLKKNESEAGQSINV